MIINWAEMQQEEQTAFKQQLEELLLNGVVELKFEKADGTIREMWATREPSKIIIFPKKTDRVKKENPEVMNVFDIGINEWRSFRLDSLRTIHFNTGE